MINLFLVTQQYINLANIISGFNYKMEADVQSDVHTNLGNGNQEIHQISESFQYCEISDCKVLSSSVKLVKLVTENVELSKDSDNDYPANKDAKDGDGDVLNDKSDLSSPHVVVKVPDRTGKSSHQIFDYSSM